MCRNFTKNTYNDSEINFISEVGVSKVHENGFKVYIPDTA